MASKDKQQPAAAFWFRRDLRFHDNTGLFHAFESGLPLIPVFIFDRQILEKLENPKDPRVEFIHEALQNLQEKLVQLGSTLVVRHGMPLDVWKALTSEFNLKAVYTNTDYEPDARRRDKIVKRFLADRGIAFHSYRDQVIFEKDEISKAGGGPYVMFTPYKNRWRDRLSEDRIRALDHTDWQQGFWKSAPRDIPGLTAIGFKTTGYQFPSSEIPENIIRNYDKTRDFPGMQGTTRLGIHLRFGTISIRELVRAAMQLNETFLNELIWREFFMSILYHFPSVVDSSFREEYDRIPWLNKKEEFGKWCHGETGFPMVDAGMRELNSTGFMHNRVRMLTANFLTKLLLIDWRWGEAYFDRKLFDFELASNNGNWQWSAGSGCDAAPYFRIFNPDTQIKKFDPELKYIKRWIPEYGTPSYPQPIVNYRMARERALQVYGDALKKK